MSFLQTTSILLDRYVPNTLKAEPTAYRKARIIAASAFVTCLTAIGYGAQNVVLFGNPLSAAGLVLGGLQALLSFPLLKNGKIVAAAHNLALVYFWVICMLVAMSGGAHSVLVAWLAVAPISATLMAGRRVGIFWVVMTLLEIAVFNGLDLLGIAMPQVYDSRTLTLVNVFSNPSFVVALFLFAAMAEMQQRHAVRLAEQARQNAEAAAERMELMKIEIEMQKILAERTGQKVAEQHEYLRVSVEEMQCDIKRFADGDLTIMLSSTNDDEMSRLASSINDSVRQIRAIVENVYESAGSITEVSTNMSAVTSHVEQAMVSQADQTRYIAGAVEEMSATSTQNSNNCLRAAEEAESARKEAKQGGVIVQETIVGMNQIADVVLHSAQDIEALGKSGEQIGKITDTIKEIAEQTNLLALNAAIEAARAGEAGRGFGVVADEVRKLAERTTKATKEIALMLTTIQSETDKAVQAMHEGRASVEGGKEAAARAATALTNIIKRTTAVADLITQIAAASEQQAQTSMNLAQNVETIASATAQTVSDMQAMTECSHYLATANTRLHSSVGRFILTERPNGQATLHQTHPLIARKHLSERSVAFS